MNRNEANAVTEAPPVRLPRAATHLPDALLVLFGVAFAVLCFANRYLPLLDLPQHAAMLSIWTHLDDPAYGFQEQFQLNWRTPYLTGYALARPWVGLLGPAGAMKLVIVISTLGMLLAVRLFVRTLGHDPWLALVGLPLSLGASFHHGFISFGLALPLFVLCLALSLRLRHRTRLNASSSSSAHSAGGRRLGLGLSLGLLLVLLTHPFAYAIALSTCAVLLASGAPKRYLWAGAPSLGLFVAWLPGAASDGERLDAPEKWQLGLDRIWDFPGTLLGLGAVDGLATAFGIGLAALILVHLGRPCRDLSRHVLLVVAILGTLLFPFQLRGVAFLHERFAPLVLIGLILSCEPKTALRAPSPRRLLLALLPAAWLGVLFVRTHQFNEEAKGFPSLVAHMPAKLRVRPIMVKNASQAFPGSYPFVHFAAYYQAEKGGYLGFSFAQNPTSFVLYKPGVWHGMRPDQEWQPLEFSPRKELPNYDYVIVRAETDLGPFLFGAELGRVALDVRSGDFWGYRVRDPRSDSEEQLGR